MTSDSVSRAQRQDPQGLGPQGRQSGVEATDEYFDEQDVFGQWVEERCETGPKHWDQPTTLFRDWAAFTKQHGEDTGTMVAFTGKLKKGGFRKGKVTGIRAYRGLALKRQERPDD